MVGATQREPEASRSRDSVREYAPITRYWYLLAISGVIALVVGIVVLTNPERSLKALAVITGIYLLVVGVLIFVEAILDHEQGPGGMLLGILALIAGVIVVRHPSQSVVAVSLAIGIYFLIAGALALAAAIIGPHRLFALARGVVLIALGVIITSSSEISVKTLALLTGIALCLQGVIQIGEALMLRSAYRSESH